MRLKKVGENVLQWLFVNYLRWIERTVTIRWDEENRYGDSQIFGFWHEDSFFMNLVLEKLAHKTAPVDVIVTADTRGNYIENMVKRCGGNALRVPDGYKAFAALKKIVQDSYEKTHSIAVALDGPLGPRHEPKTTVTVAVKNYGVVMKNQIPELPTAAGKTEAAAAAGIFSAY